MKVNAVSPRAFCVLSCLLQKVVANQLRLLCHLVRNEDLLRRIMWFVEPRPATSLTRRLWKPVKTLDSQNKLGGIRRIFASMALEGSNQLGKDTLLFKHP